MKYILVILFVNILLQGSSQEVKTANTMADTFYLVKEQIIHADISEKKISCILIYSLKDTLYVECRDYFKKSNIPYVPQMKMDYLKGSRDFLLVRAPCKLTEQELALFNSIFQKEVDSSEININPKRKDERFFFLRYTMRGDITAKVEVFEDLDDLEKPIMKKLTNFWNLIYNDSCVFCDIKDFTICEKWGNRYTAQLIYIPTDYCTESYRIRMLIQYIERVYNCHVASIKEKNKGVTYGNFIKLKIKANVYPIK